MTILRSIAAPSLALRHPCLPSRSTTVLVHSIGPMAAPRDPIDLGGPMGPTVGGVVTYRTGQFDQPAPTWFQSDFCVNRTMFLS
jgi:hypothetical protein